MNRPVSLYQQAGKGNDDKAAMTYFQRAVPEWIDSQSYVLKKIMIMHLMFLKKIENTLP